MSSVYCKAVRWDFYGEAELERKEDRLIREREKESVYAVLYQRHLLEFHFRLFNCPCNM